MNENLAGMRPESFGQSDDPLDVFLRRTKFRHHVSDEQAQFLGDVVVAGWQFVV